LAHKVAGKVTITLPGGRTAQAVEVPVDSSNEKWSEFSLSDGTTLRIKINLITVMRAEGEYAPGGGPIYQVTAAPTIVFTDVPDSLKQPKAS
jgi:hypothetical protein